MFEHADGWVDAVLVRVLPAPPPLRITSPGRRRVSVGCKRADGYIASNDGVVLAWARTAGGDWAMLFVWTGHRRVEGRRMPSARWSWCTAGRVQVFVSEPVKDANPWGMTWYGHPDAALNAAIVEAVASLPEPMRPAAARPVPREGELWLESLNPCIVRQRPGARRR